MFCLNNHVEINRYICLQQKILILISMEKLIYVGFIVTIIYQIYTTHKNVGKLMDKIDGLERKIDQLKK